MLELRRLRLLREFRLRGSIAAVAAATSFSPSAVSQQLSQLEREAGVELLRRSGRRLVLTPAAERLVERAGEMLDAIERAEAELAGASDLVAGTVRLAVFQSAVLALLAPTLELLRERHPGLRVEVTQREPETALFDVWARDFDLVVAEQYPAHAAPHHPGLDRRPLLGDAIRLAVPAAGPASGIDTVAAARDAPWVVEPRGAASRHFAEQLCRSAGFEPDLRFETADLQVHARLVASGHAVALLPDLLWEGATPTAGVVLHEPAGRPRRTVFTAAREAGAASPGIVAVRAALEEVAADLGQRRPDW